MRGGSRRRTDSLIVHLAAGGSKDEAIVGFVVGRSVGGAVVRNTVKRRLRALMATRMGQLQEGDFLVVRALPSSAGQSSARLGGNLDVALARLGRPVISPSDEGAKQS